MVFQVQENQQKRKTIIELDKDINYEYISSDKIRGEIYGDEGCQDNPSAIFDIMFKRTKEALDKGNSIIYDATNINRKRRIALLKQLPENVHKICVIVWSKIETCIERDLLRERKVGKDVILKMAKRFETPWYDEGWEGIKLSKNDENYKLSDFDLNIPHDNPHHPGTIQEHVDRVCSERQIF